MNKSTNAREVPPAPDAKLWYCAACTKLITPAGSEGAINAVGEHYCETCTMLNSELSQSDAQKNARAGTFTAINSCVLQAPEEMSGRTEKEAANIQRVASPANSRQVSMVTLAMMAGAAGALIAGVLVAAFFMFSRQPQVTVIQPAPSVAPLISQPQPSRTEGEPAKPVKVLERETVPQTNAVSMSAEQKPSDFQTKVTIHPVNPDSPGLLQWPNAGEKPKPKEAAGAAISSDRTPDLIEYTPPTTIEQKTPSANDTHRIEYLFQKESDLENWKQLETGWSIADGALTCARPGLNQRIELSTVLTGNVVVTYEGRSQADVGLSFVNANDPSKFDRVIVGGMKGDQVGLMSAGKGKPKTIPCRIADGQSHIIEVRRSSKGLRLYIDKKDVAFLPAEQMQQLSEYRLRLHLWNLPGTFSRLVIDTKPKEETE
jgi:hypothetical protein